MGFRFGVSGWGFRVLGFGVSGFRVWDLGLWGFKGFGDLTVLGGNCLGLLYVHVGNEGELISRMVSFDELLCIYTGDLEAKAFL